MQRLIMMMITLSAPTLAFAHFNDSRNFGWGNHMGMFGWGGGGFMMMVFYAIVLFFIVSSISGFFKRKSRLTESGIQILKERFAKGEITLSEFKEMKQQIKF